MPAWMTIVVLSLSGMAVSLQFTLPIPILPSMPHILGITSNDASWIVTATLLTSTIATPIISRMADMYGKRRMLLISLAMMALGSVIVATSSTFAIVLLGRGVQGIAAAVVPIGISLLKDKLPAERSNSAVALMSATLGIGSAMGMPLSGLISEGFGWRAVFWCTAVTGAVLVVLMLVIVSESPLRTGGRFDIAGAILLAIVLTATLLVISKVGQWPPVALLALAVITLVGLAGWIPLQLRHKQPMVDLRTAITRPVLLTNIASFFTGIAMFSNMLLTTQQVQAPLASGHKFELTVITTGLVMLPSGIAMVVLAPLSGWLLDRFGGRPVLILGNLILAAGFVIRIFFDSTIPSIIVGSAIIGIGTSFAYASMPTLIMAAVPNTATSAANGVNSLVRSLGTAFCSAIVGFLVGVMAAPAGGGDFLSMEGLHLCFAIAAGSAAIAALIAVFVPRGIRSAPSAEDVAPGAQSIVRGRITMGDEVRPRTSAIVTFMRLDGTPLDWSRIDGDGQYLAVLPGPGRYVATASAVGWAPSSGVLEVDGEQARWDATLATQFTIGGTVTCSSGPAAHAVITFYLGGNEFVGAVHCDARGAYELPLPAAGRYVVTAIGADGTWTHSTKATVDLESVRLDIRAGATADAAPRTGAHRGALSHAAGPPR